jgi:hypothetical protein
MKWKGFKMRYVYYIDGEKFTTDNENEIPWLYISSFNEEIPAFEDLENGNKVWCQKGYHCHRLTGPARVWPGGDYYFFLNNSLYIKVNAWLKDHPNQDNAFQVEMLLKYT